MEYYPACKRKEILTHATAWMNFDDIMPSEIRQSQKHTDLTHMDVLKVVKLIETEWWLPGTGVRGNGKLFFNGHRVSVL